MSTIRSVITATGSYIPPVRIANEHFLNHDFRDANGAPLDKTTPEIIKQFEAITGIRERRYVTDDLATSDMALDSSGIDPETLDGIIVAHNFGDVRAGSRRSDLVPALAARVKSRLRIVSPRAIAFDLVFGCPGWLQGMIQADSMIRAGDAKRVLVIGAETLSRVSDPHDRDSMIYADGAGATIIEARESDHNAGVISHIARSDTLDHAGMLFMGPSYNEEVFIEALFLKMEGRKLYRYALATVASSMKACLDKAGISIGAIKKILLHQANGKMDEAILEAFYDLYDVAPPDNVLPMTISWLGNSSVATLPTLLDLITKQQLNGHTIDSGDLVLFGSVGAGMHINAMLYRVP
jgi:3-oxoacyl-[acyl-carrier-protein] synthase-3